MSIGFTGTRTGMTGAQKNALRAVLGAFGTNFTFHHGDCVGADDDAHTIAADLSAVIIIHPPTSPNLRALRTGPHVTVLPPRAYLVRNQRIVDSSDLLVAAPHSLDEEQRSGTWATVRYARKTGTPVVILDPGGP